MLSVLLSSEVCLFKWFPRLVFRDLHTQAAYNQCLSSVQFS